MRPPLQLSDTRGGSGRSSNWDSSRETSPAKSPNKGSPGGVSVGAARLPHLLSALRLSTASTTTPAPPPAAPPLRTPGPRERLVLRPVPLLGRGTRGPRAHLAHVGARPTQHRLPRHARSRGIHRDPRPARRWAPASAPTETSSTTTGTRTRSARSRAGAAGGTAAAGRPHRRRGTAAAGRGLERGLGPPRRVVRLKGRANLASCSSGGRDSHGSVLVSSPDDGGWIGL